VSGKESITVQCINGHDTKFTFTVDNPDGDACFKSLAFSHMVSGVKCKECGVRLQLPLTDDVTPERLENYYGVVDLTKKAM
jgi:hypothetical protein